MGTLGTPGVSSTDSIPVSFCSQILWGLIFLALEPWAEVHGVGLGFLTPKISLSSFYPPHVFGTRLFCVSALPTRLDGCGFFNSVVVRRLFNSISQFWVMVALQFSFNFYVVLEGGNHVYLCLHVDNLILSSFTNFFNIFFLSCFSLHSNGFFQVQWCYFCSVQSDVKSVNFKFLYIIFFQSYNFYLF